MQSVLGGSLHKNNTSYLLLGLYHASVNRIAIVLMQTHPKMNNIMGFVQVVNSSKFVRRPHQPCRTFSENFRRLLKITEDYRRLPRIAEDFRGRPEDVSIIRKRI